MGYVVVWVRASQGGGAQADWASSQLCQRREVRAQAARSRAEFEFGPLASRTHPPISHPRQVSLAGRFPCRIPTSGSPYE